MNNIICKNKIYGENELQEGDELGQSPIRLTKFPNIGKQV